MAQWYLSLPLDTATLQLGGYYARLVNSAVSSHRYPIDITFRVESDLACSIHLSTSIRIFHRRSLPDNRAAMLLFSLPAPDPPPTAGRITLQAESDTQAVWLTYVRKHTSRPLATAMPQALATRPSSRACWRVKIHMPFGTQGAAAPSRTNLRASMHECRAWGVATKGTAILTSVGGTARVEGTLCSIY